MFSQLYYKTLSHLIITNERFLSCHFDEGEICLFEKISPSASWWIEKTALVKLSLINSLCQIIFGETPKLLWEHKQIREFIF